MMFIIISHLVVAIFVYYNVTPLQSKTHHLFRLLLLLLPLLFLVTSGEYIPAFASQPKIPRTPDTAASQNSAHRGRGLTLAPQFSQSEPQQSSRPGSANSAGGGGRQSGSKHMVASQCWQILAPAGYFVYSTIHFGR